MTTAAAIAVPAPTYQLVPLKLLAESPLNHRKNFDKDKLAELAESIRKHGVLQPALARPVGKAFELVFGHRRLRAAALAGLEAMPVIIREMTDKEVLEAQVIENVQREDVHPLEEAEGYRALTETHGMTVDELAAKIGKSKSYIYSRLKLCALTKTAKKAFQEDQFNAAIAYLVARLPAGQQDEAVKLIVEELEYNGPLTFEEASKVIQQQFMLQLAGAPFDTQSATLVPKAGACTTCPKRTGNQKDLFADVKSTDVCTDLGCFNQKKEANTKVMLEAAAAAGQRVLTGNEAKKALQYGSNFVKLDEKSYEDPKYRTYGQLLGKKADPVLVIDDRGAVQKVIPKAELPKLLKEAGHDFKAPSSSRGNDHDAKRIAKIKRINAIGRAAMEQVLAHVEAKGISAKLMGVLARDVFEHSNADAKGWIADRRGMPAKGGGHTKGDLVLKAVKEMDDGEHQQLLVETILQHGATAFQWGEAKLGANFQEACAIAGVNLKKLEKSAAEKPAKPAAKKKAS